MGNLVVIREMKTKASRFDGPAQPLRSKGNLRAESKHRADTANGPGAHQNMNYHISSQFRDTKEPVDGPSLTCRKLAAAPFLTLTSGQKQSAMRSGSGQKY